MLDDTPGPGLEVSLAGIAPQYTLPNDPFARDVLVPALRVSREVDLKMGYFTSSSFAQIAPGLAAFIAGESRVMRLIISPAIKDVDFDVLTMDSERLMEFARGLFLQSPPTENDLVRHTLECLAWMLSTGRLEIKIAVMRNGMFHPKIWIFRDGKHAVAAHGSSNLTQSGLGANRESVTIHRDWRGDDNRFTVAKFQTEFTALWNGGDGHCKVLSVPDAVKKEIVERYKTDQPPTGDSVAKFWEEADAEKVPITGSDWDAVAQLKIPNYLVYDAGDFAHQGQAADAWRAADRRGILEMATGSGKTITSMICATILQDEVDKLLVVVSAPYRPLIEQWCGEIAEFGVSATNLSAAGGPADRSREIKQAGRRLRMGLSKVEILVVSNDTLCTDEFLGQIGRVPASKLLIADECHNLGASPALSGALDFFDFRLGLSATPVRQYDEEGTRALVAFFGDICFAFTLEQAIGKCLTHYDYHVHFVELSGDEMAQWQELTEKISAMAWKLGSGEKDPYLDNLLRQRRLVLETAADKIEILRGLLGKVGFRDLSYTLIYATDKDPEQLDAVNDLLNANGVLFHQLTHEETQKRETTQTILDSFQEGSLKVLTAKRVLDEGVNIPQIKLAYILASTTVTRQWVQRRGRLLRLCKAIGKTHAVIHDFVVLPPGTAHNEFERLDGDARKLVRSELQRVWEFARLSRNGPENGGPYEAVRHLQALANESVI